MKISSILTAVMLILITSVQPVSAITMTQLKERIVPYAIVTSAIVSGYLGYRAYTNTTVKSCVQAVFCNIGLPLLIKNYLANFNSTYAMKHDRSIIDIEIVPDLLYPDDIGGECLAINIVASGVGIGTGYYLSNR